MKMILLAILGTCCLVQATHGVAPPVRHIPLGHGPKLNVSIGTPPQTFEMLLDTGSAGTWVYGEDCDIQLTSVLDSDDRRQFGTDASATLARDDRNWRMYYSFGGVFSGKLYRDNLEIQQQHQQQQPGDSLLVANQLFGLATRVKGWLVSLFEFDGVLGVGDRLRPVLDADSPLEALFKQHSLPRSVFSLHVNRPNERHHFNGTLILGGIDSRYYTGDIHYVPIQSRWEIKLDYMKVGGSEKMIGIRRDAVLDSSTNIIVGPQSEVEYIIESFERGRLDPYIGLYKFVSCEKALASRTKLIIMIGGRPFELATKDLIIRMRYAEEEDACYLALRGNLDGGNKREKFNYWTLGLPFLKKYYTIYDDNSKRVGFANST